MNKGYVQVTKLAKFKRKKGEEAAM